MRFSRFTELVLVLSCTIAPPFAKAGVIVFNDAGGYAAATTGSTVIAFGGIIPSGLSFEGFSTLTVSSVSFTSLIPGTTVNVTKADYYSPNTYPADFIVDSTNNNAVNSVGISFPATYAFALDFGQLFGNSIGGSMTLSNGFRTFFYPPNLPSAPHTQFVGFLSTTPITNVTFVVSDDSWVVQDFVLSSVPEPISGFMLAAGLFGLALYRRYAG